MIVPPPSSRLLRFAGVAAVGVLWTTVGVGMWRVTFDVTGDRAISYLGTDARTMALFSGGLLVATVLLLGFAWAVERNLARPTGFFGVFLVGMVGQAVVATVPIAGEGLSHAVHTTGGIVLGLSLPLFIWRFAAAQPPGRWRRRSYRLLWVEVAAVVAGVALSRVHLAVVAEVVPAVAFHLWIIVVTAQWQAGTPYPADGDSTSQPAGDVVR